VGLDLPPLIYAIATIATAIVTAIGTIWVAKSKARVDIGTTITAGFRELTDQLQEERGHLADLIRRQRDELAAAEKSIGELERTLRRARRHVAGLEDRMERAGLEVPAKEGWE
jgi:chromosome segregation ATPase